MWKEENPKRPFELWHVHLVLLRTFFFENFINLTDLVIGHICRSNDEIRKMDTFFMAARLTLLVYLSILSVYDKKNAFYAINFDVWDMFR